VVNGRNIPIRSKGLEQDIRKSKKKQKKQKKRKKRRKKQKKKKKKKYDSDDSEDEKEEKSSSEEESDEEDEESSSDEDEEEERIIQNEGSLLNTFIEISFQDNSQVKFISIVHHFYKGDISFIENFISCWSFSYLETNLISSFHDSFWLITSYL